MHLQVEFKHINNDQEINKDIFSKKWDSVDKFEQMEKIEEWQFQWYLTLYGFESEEIFKEFLHDKDVILDAGCGLGYKAAWFAKLNPHATVIGMDISDSVFIAAENYKDISNLIFIQGDLAKTDLEDNSIDFLSCDQVLHHTENPNNTLKEFSRITKSQREMALYVYKKKGLPRELLDEHFISGERTLSYKEREDLSEQLTILGKMWIQLLSAPFGVCDTTKVNWYISFVYPHAPRRGAYEGVYSVDPPPKI